MKAPPESAITVRCGGVAIVSNSTDCDPNKVVARADDLMRLYDQRAKSVYSERNTTGLATIGLAVAAAAAAIYKAHSDTVVGLGLAGGTTASTIAYFNPGGQYVIYRTGVKALDCVANAGANAIKAAVRYSQSPVFNNTAQLRQRIVPLSPPQILIAGDARAQEQAQALQQIQLQQQEQVIELYILATEARKQADELGPTINQAIDKVEMAILDKLEKNRGALAFTGLRDSLIADAAKMREQKNKAADGAKLLGLSADAPAIFDLAALKKELDICIAITQ